tara:strand:+ start:600 stop:947 length:348 start_codon:yes stop_codon:yes gene_type:complete
MTKLVTKNWLYPALLIIFGSISPSFAGSGHQSSAGKADCGTLKTLLDNGVAPQDIAKDALVMQAMMNKCASHFKPSVDPTAHDSPSRQGQTPVAPTAQTESKPVKIHDDSHAHQH